MTTPLRQTTVEGGEDIRTSSEEDRAYEAVVLKQVLTLHPSPVTLEELIRELGDQRDFSQRDAVERAVRDLAGSGLLHRCGTLVLPSRAALRFEELNED